VWDVLGPILKVVGGVLGGTLLATLSGIIGAIAGVIGPIIDWISMLIANIIQVIDGIIQFVGGALRTIGGFFSAIVGLIKGIITGDFSQFKEAVATIWQGIKDMFSGIATILGAIWSTIWQTIKGLIDTIVGAVSGFVQGIVDFFTWLWDVLVGHSIVPDMVTAIIDWFKNMWDTCVEFVKNLVDGVVQFFTDLWNNSVELVTNLVNGVIDWFNEMWYKANKAAEQLVINVVAWFLDMRRQVLEWIADLVTSALKNWNDFKDSIINVAQTIWDKIVEKFQSIRDGVMEKVNLLKDAATTAFENMRDNLLGAFEYVKDKIGDVFTGITGFIKDGINGGIKAVNKLIDGLNKVADILPGLDWNISSIPLLAKGGAIPSRRVGGGFETNGARAIVGEGKANYPEFVIPTDPTHRRRASALYEELGKRIGAGTDDTGLGIGGWEDVKAFIGKGADLAKDGVDWLKDVAQGAASVVFDPVRQIAQNMIDGMTWKFGKKTAQAGLDQVWEWVTGTDEAYRKAATEVGGAGPWKKPATGYRMSSPFGMRTHPITGQRRLHDGVDLAGPMGSPIYAAAAGRVTYHSMNGGLGQYAKVDHGGGLATWYGHLSGYVGGPRQVSPGELIARMGSTGASTGSHLHFIVKQGGAATNPVPFMAAKGVPLAMGGIARATRGGTLATIGEGGRDEAVIPLPTGWKQLFNRTTLVSLNDRLDRAIARMERVESIRSGNTYNDNRSYHFYGDISLPNIKNSNDAEKFFQNLEDLAGDK